MLNKYLRFSLANAFGLRCRILMRLLISVDVFTHRAIVFGISKQQKGAISTCLKTDKFCLRIDFWATLISRKIGLCDQIVRNRATFPLRVEGTIVFVKFASWQKSFG